MSSPTETKLDKLFQVYTLFAYTHALIHISAVHSMNSLPFSYRVLLPLNEIVPGLCYLSTYFTFLKFVFTISSIFIYFIRLCWFTSSCVYINFSRACLFSLVTISSVLFNIQVEFPIVFIYRSIKKKRFVALIMDTL